MRSRRSFETWEELFSSLEEPWRSEIRELDRIIRETLPDELPTIAGDMLGYGPFRYRYKSGREGDTCVVSLSANKKCISLHVFGADRFKERLPRADIGVACVRFKRLEDLDRSALVELLRQAPNIRNIIEKKV